MEFFRVMDRMVKITINTITVSFAIRIFMYAVFLMHLSAISYFLL